MGQNMLAAHFGLGQADTADSVTVKWPSGKVQTLTDVAANQHLVVVERQDEPGVEGSLPRHPNGDDGDDKPQCRGGER